MNRLGINILIIGEQIDRIATDSAYEYMVCQGVKWSLQIKIN
jgi:hypothetical protein